MSPCSASLWALQRGSPQDRARLGLVPPLITRRSPKPGLSSPPHPDPRRPPPLHPAFSSARGRAVCRRSRHSAQRLPRKTYVSARKVLPFFFFFGFLGLHLWHREVPRLGGKSKLQLPAWAAATATQELSCVCDLHDSSWQHRIPNPLSEARD